MQRYGPPPAYPNLKIPGVNNAPIPDAIAYGFGRLFTDERGFTVYADCHGLNKAVYQKRQNRKPNWGAVKDGAAGDEDALEEEEDDEEDEEDEDNMRYIRTTDQNGEINGNGREYSDDEESYTNYREEHKVAIGAGSIISTNKLG